MRQKTVRGLCPFLGLITAHVVTFRGHRREAEKVQRMQGFAEVS
jgi:hypothetical protein